MFSRTLLADKHSETIATHQRIVRASRREALKYLPRTAKLPSAKQINRFEGKNGPDGLAGKHNVLDFPTEFVDPENNDGLLFQNIKNHMHALRIAYRQKNSVRVAFEMAWLEHIIVDGLTPAHHQPFKQQIKDLDPREAEEINGLFKRIFMPGDNMFDVFIKNWKRLGPGGLGTAHIMFEAGIDFIMMPLPPSTFETNFTVQELVKARGGRYLQLYDSSIRRINQLHMFERYEEEGWTTSLAADVRETLLPECVKMVTLAWLAAMPRRKK